MLNDSWIDPQWGFLIYLILSSRIRFRIIRNIELRLPIYTESHISSSSLILSHQWVFLQFWLLNDSWQGEILIYLILSPRIRFNSSVFFSSFECCIIVGEILIRVPQKNTFLLSLLRFNFWCQMVSRGHKQNFIVVGFLISDIVLIPELDLIVFFLPVFLKFWMLNDTWRDLHISDIVFEN